VDRITVDRERLVLRSVAAPQFHSGSSAALDERHLRPTGNQNVPVGGILRRHPVATAWSMVAVMASATTALVGAIPLRGALVETGTSWWVMGAAFAITEARSLHLMTGRGAHTLNPVEIPLVVALGILTGPGVVLARLFGAVLYVVVLRRQTPLKAAFNIASGALGAAVSASVAALATGGIADPATWAWIFLGCLLGGFATSLAVAAVLTVFDSERSGSEARRELLAALIQISVGTTIGLMVLLPMALNPWTVVLTSGLAVAFLASFHVYGRLRQRHMELEAVYAFATSIDDASSLDEMAVEILEGMASGLKVPNVELMVESEDTRRHLVWSRGAAVDLTESSPTGTGGSPDPARLVAQLRSGPNLVIGWVSVSGREEEIGFTTADHRLLSAMASQAGASLSRALVEARLRRELEHNQQLIRSKDQLIAAVSHELRTPLTGILGFAEILRDSQADLDQPAKVELAGSVASEALDLSFIVEDLLTAARFELGQLNMRLDEIAVTDLIASVLKPIRERSHKRVTSLATPLRAIGDPARARQILRNLVTNAIRYGGPNIEVACLGSDATLAIEVRDDGDGVGAENAERIFLPYETAHHSTTQPGSVGLGLPISRELARMMGGDVRFERRGRLTVFALVLPISSGETFGFDGIEAGTATARG
jgi:signal transduction histidine kinase